MSSALHGFVQGFLGGETKEIRDQEEADRVQAEKYENALFEMKMKGQEERRKKHKNVNEMWNKVNQLRDSGDTRLALATFAKANDMPLDTVLSSMKSELGDNEKLEANLGKMDKYLDNAYKAFKDRPEPTYDIDTPATLNYRRAADKHALGGFLRDAFGIRDTTSPMTPYAAHSRALDEFYKKEAEMDAAERPTDVEGGVGSFYGKVKDGGKSGLDASKIEYRPSAPPEGEDPNFKYEMPYYKGTNQQVVGADGTPMYRKLDSQDIPPPEFATQAADVAATYWKEKDANLDKYASKHGIDVETIADIKRRLGEMSPSEQAELEKNYGYYVYKKSGGKMTIDAFVEHIASAVGVDISSSPEDITSTESTSSMVKRSINGVTYWFDPITKQNLGRVVE